MISMEEIIKKRSDLLNYFFNESKTYSKLEILNREFSALTFSPREEFIDAFETEFDDVLTPISDIEENQDEVLLKGIIIDVDMKKDYAILHIQNKADNFSVSCDKPVVRKYGDYFNTGDIVVVKGHTYNGKVFMHFMINYNSEDSFLQERNYLNGISQAKIDDIDYAHTLGLIGLLKQVKYFKSKAKGTPCVRIEVYEHGQNKVYITCNNYPENLVAGMFVSYWVGDNPAFCNNLQEVQL